jgi:hypothetical protein
MKKKKMMMIMMYVRDNGILQLRGGRRPSGE